VQNVFTDRRAYVTALTYSIETEASAPSRQRKQKALSQYKQEITGVEFPDGSKQNYNYDQLEETYNDLKNERTKLSAELGEVLKPLNEQKEKLDAFLSERMVDLTPEQIRGLQSKTEAWDSKIVQINVAEANIVDRCESCHMGIREPVKLSAISMSVKGKKPDEYARAFTSHPEPDLLKAHDPKNSAVLHAIREMAAPRQAWKRLTALTSTGCGRCFPKEMQKPAARPVTPPIWCWSPTKSAGRSAKARICSGSAAASDATATRDTTRSRKICF
jgi:hypothetical protein